MPQKNAMTPTRRGEGKVRGVDNALTGSASSNNSENCGEQYMGCDLGIK